MLHIFSFEKRLKSKSGHKAVYDTIYKRVCKEYSVTSASDSTIEFSVKPDLLYRNSFLPDVCVNITENNSKVDISLLFSLKKSVRIFNYIWLGIVFLVAVIVAIINIKAIFIPLITIALNLLINFFGLRFSSKEVFQTIQEDID